MYNYYIPKPIVIKPYLRYDRYVIATSSYILYLPESDVSSTFTVCGRRCKCLLIQLCRDGLGL